MADITNAVAYAFAKNYSGSGNWLDESGNSHDGTITNALFYDHTGTNYVRLPGLASNNVSTPDATKFDIVDDGNIDLRWLGEMPDWTPAAAQYLISCYTTSGSVGWLWEMGATSGFMRFSVGDGAIRQAIADAATGFTDGTKQGVRVTWTASTDTVTFYKMDDPDDVSGLDTSAWTQIGSTRSTGVTSATAGSVAVRIGAHETGGTYIGKVYAAQVYDGVAGTKVADFVADDWTDLTTTYTDGQSNVWTMNQSGTAELARIIDRPAFWFDTDAFIELADAADLDFALADDFTIGVGLRNYGWGGGAHLLVKRGASAVGYILYDNTTPRFHLQAPVGQTGTDDGPAITNGAAATVIGVKNTTDDDLEAFSEGVGSGTPTTDPTTDTAANAEKLYIGANGSGSSNYFQGEIWAYAVIRSALTDGEVVNLHGQLITQDTGQASPATLSISAAIPSPTLAAGSSVTPAPVSVSITIPSGVAGIAFTTAPSPVNIVVTIPAPFRVGPPPIHSYYTLRSSQRSEFTLRSV